MCREKYINIHVLALFFNLIDFGKVLLLELAVVLDCDTWAIIPDQRFRAVLVACLGKSAYRRLVLWHAVLKLQVLHDRICPWSTPWQEDRVREARNVYVEYLKGVSLTAFGSGEGLLTIAPLQSNTVICWLFSFYLMYVLSFFIAYFIWLHQLFLAPVRALLQFGCTTCLFYFVTGVDSQMWSSCRVRTVLIITALSGQCKSPRLCFTFNCSVNDLLWIWE